MDMRALAAGRQESWRTSRTSRAPLALVDSMASEPQHHGVADFGEIAELHRALLHRVALRLSGNAETAKDLVQETLLRGLRRFDQFQQGRHAGTWLVTILTNLFYDHLKHEKVVRKAEPELVVPEAVECDPESTIAVIADADLHAAVQALEPELREVVELCYLKQLRYREVSEILNLPVGTIGTRLMRARARLRVLLTNTSRES
jgi:RNA polymerase sigma-70 factor (ECF subfamily)